MARTKKQGGKKPKDKEQALVDVTAIKMDVKELPVGVKELFTELTHQQKLFVVAYCGDAGGNATLAARMAGAGQSDSYASISSRGHQLLWDPKVQAVITAWLEAFAITKQKIIAMLADLAEATLDPFVKVEGDELRLAITPDNWAAYRGWVKGVETSGKSNKVTKILLHDRIAAIRELAKILKLYSDQPQLNLTLNLRKMADDELMKFVAQAREGVRSWLPNNGGS